MRVIKMLLPISLMLCNMSLNNIDCIKCNTNLNCEKNNYQTKKLNINNTTNNDVSAIQYNRIKEILDERFGTYNISNVRNLYDPNLNLKYFCVELDPIGYLIYDIVADRQIEYTDEISSPYLGVVDTAIYIGPKNYYSYNNSQFTNLLTGNTLLVSQSNQLSLLNNELSASRTTYLQEIENETSTYAISPVQTFFAVPYYYYFYNAAARYMPTGTTQCGHVAIELLMGYYDTFYNDNIVPETEDEASLRWDYPTFETSTTPVSFYSSPGVGVDFFNAIYNLGIELLDLTAIDCLDSEIILDEYFDRYVEEDISYSISTYDASHESNLLTVSTAIENGQPAIVDFIGYSEEDGMVINHAALAYIVDRGDICVNWGWNETTTTNVNISQYSIYQALTFNYTGNHVHSDNYINITDDIMHTYMCPCGDWSEIELHRNDVIVALSKVKHVKICAICRREVEEPHTFSSGVCMTCQLDKTSQEYIDLPDE